MSIRKRLAALEMEAFAGDFLVDAIRAYRSTGTLPANTRLAANVRNFVEQVERSLAPDDAMARQVLSTVGSSEPRKFRSNHKGTANALTT